MTVVHVSLSRPGSLLPSEATECTGFRVGGHSLPPSLTNRLSQALYHVSQDQGQAL